MVDVVVLDFHLTGDSFFERGDIFKDFAAFLHPQVENLKLIFDVLIFLFNLPAQLFNEFGMLHEFFIDCCKNSSLKDFGIVGNHEGNLLYSELVFSLAGLDFVDQRR